MLFKKNDTRGYRVFTICNIVFLGLLGLVCFLPFWHIFCKSLSSGAAVSANLVGLWPSGFTLQSYKEALTDARILRALWVSVERVFFGTLFTMVTTILAAYPLSFDARTFPSRRIYSCVFIFTMLFGGGTIPTYILINNILKMTDTIWWTARGRLPHWSRFICPCRRPVWPHWRASASSVIGTPGLTPCCSCGIPPTTPCPPICRWWAAS